MLTGEAYVRMFMVLLLLLLPLLTPLSLLPSPPPIALVPATLATVAAEDGDSSSRSPSVDRENTGTSSRGGIDVWKAFAARRRRIRESLFMFAFTRRGSS
jgi:hypothetical protein